jgi:hypothetical protein
MILKVVALIWNINAALSRSIAQERHIIGLTSAPPPAGILDRLEILHIN